MAQKLFSISEKGPLSGAARSHANLLRSGSVPPLQRLCQEAVLRASWVCSVHLLPCIPSARFGIYYSIRPKRSKGRNPLFTWGLRGVIGRTRGVITDGSGVILYLHAGLRSNSFG